MPLVTKRTRCRVCLKEHNVTVDNPAVFEGEFGSMCPVCKQNTVHVLAGATTTGKAPVLPKREDLAVTTVLKPLSAKEQAEQARK